MKNISFLLLIGIFITLILWGCEDEFWQQDKPEKYTSPPWLKGKISELVKDEEDLSTFSSFLQKTGYDSIIDDASHTVFAPTNKAFEEFFQDHPEYKSMLESGESSEKLERLVEYQVLFNAWSRDQFESLDIDGWIDPEERLSEPKAYKRKTLLKENNKSYPVRYDEGEYQIVEPSKANMEKKAYTQSNKFVPIFFQRYLNAYQLQGSDYEYYFNRSFNSEDLYYAGARFDESIPAENGFIYKTDRVILPLPNGEEILEQGTDNHSYDKFLNLIHQFSEFEPNMEATFDQPGAEEGLAIDTLYNLSYPDLVFNIHNELTGNWQNSHRDQHGLLAPTDEAFQSFIDQYIADGWGSFQKMPKEIKKIIVNAHMMESAFYPSEDLGSGFKNGTGDRVMLNEGDIIQKTYGSNCSFLGLNKTIIPRAFKSIAQPMYLTRNFQIMLYAVERTKVLDALKDPEADYSFYLPPDVSIGLGGDSSLFREVINRDLNIYSFKSFNRANGQKSTITPYNLRQRILNQIGATTPSAPGADKEFIRTLGDNYLVVDHNKGTVSGTAPTTYGFNGDSTINLEPEPYTGDMDNGEVYQVDTWFSFKQRIFYTLFLSRYPKFLSLLQKAGLFDPYQYDFPFITEGEYYTVFVPSEQALNNYKVDTLSKNNLRELLKYHFVKKDLIFTDGKKPSGIYTTTRIDESSTPQNTLFSTMNIRPETNVINIMDNTGNVYLEIQQEEGKTNQIVTYDSNEDSDSKWDYITTGVVHEIDKVLVKDSLQAN